MTVGRPVGAGAAGDRPAERTTAGRVGPTTIIRVSGGLRVGGDRQLAAPPTIPTAPGGGNWHAGAVTGGGTVRPESAPRDPGVGGSRF